MFGRLRCRSKFHCFSVAIILENFQFHFYSKQNLDPSSLYFYFFKHNHMPICNLKKTVYCRFMQEDISIMTGQKGNTQNNWHNR